jgi:hypothetical protein
VTKKNREEGTSNRSGSIQINDGLRRVERRQPSGRSSASMGGGTVGAVAGGGGIWHRWAVGVGSTASSVVGEKRGIVCRRGGALGSSLWAVGVEI